MKALAALLLTASAAAADIPLVWHRVNEFPQSAVLEGVCHVWAPDTSGYGRLDSVALEPLVRSCLSKGGLTGQGDFLLRWEVLESDRAVHLWAGGSRNLSKGFTVGASRRDGKICEVRTLRGMATLAHELRHCYDGAWHK